MRFSSSHQRGTGITIEKRAFAGVWPRQIMLTDAEPYLLIVIGLLITSIVMWTVLYVCMVLYKRRYSERTARMAGQLVDAIKELAPAEQIAAQFSPDDPPPYGPLVRDLKLRLQRVLDGPENCGAQ